MRVTPLDIRKQEYKRGMRGLDADGGWLHGWSGYRRVLGQAHHLLGEFHTELAKTRRGSAPGTNRYANLIAEARPLAALGRERVLDSLVNEALATPNQPTMNVGSLMQRVADELRVHGHSDAARRAFVRARGWYEEEMRRDGPRPAYQWALGRMLVVLAESDSARAVLGALAIFVWKADIHQDQIYPREGIRIFDDFVSRGLPFAVDPHIPQHASDQDKIGDIVLNNKYGGISGQGWSLDRSCFYIVSGRDCWRHFLSHLISVWFLWMDLRVSR